jgi:DNA repair exonuclease SbcCD ATPase subunit
MLDDQTLEKEITNLLIKYRGIQSSIESTNNSITAINNRLSELEYERITLKNCKPIIDDIINKFSVSLLKNLENLLTIGLKKIFFDRNFSMQIRIIDKRNSKCAELLLNDNGNLIPVKDSNIAGGILIVIASIIQIFFITNLKSVGKYLFLDEQFSQLSKIYVPNFMEFIKTLCDETGLSIVLITHDSKFMSYADRVYYADHGNFTLKDGISELQFD